MNRVPRASFCITVLSDEDYRVLMGLKGGPEAFGIFVAMVLCGRERLQQGKARQVSGTDALTFDNSLTHVTDLIRVTRKQFDNSVSTLAKAAKETGSEPWMSLDGTGHVVIRSFFKFNVNTNWGGPRPGSGRPKQENQDDPPENQVDSNLKPSRCASVSVSSSVPSSVPVSKPPTPGERAGSEPTPAGDPLEDPDPVAETWAPAPPRVVNEAAAVEAVKARVEELFPGNGWGVWAGQSCRDYPAAWVLDALRIGRAESASSWNFIDRVLERFQVAGMSDSERRQSRNTIPIGSHLRATGTEGHRLSREEKRVISDRTMREAIAKLPDNDEDYL